MSAFMRRARLRIADRRGLVLLAVYRTHVQVCRDWCSYPVESLERARIEAGGAGYRIEAGMAFDHRSPPSGRRTTPEARAAAIALLNSPEEIAIRTRRAERDAARSARIAAKYGVAK